ncbi:MAG: hypothetical protein QM777_08990 [Pseudorhodoferax sp.]
MTPKVVHAYHPISRIYVGPIELDAGDVSPLEPGVWLIPGDSLEAAPPTPGPGQYIAEEAGAWVLRDIPQPPAPPAPAPTPEPEPPTPEQIRQSLVDAIQDYMDDMAQMLGYDDIKTAVTYADEPAVPKFQSEGQALRAWRSLVWAACYAHLALVEAGEAELPTLEEAIAMLPVFTPPAD